MEEKQQKSIHGLEVMDEICPNSSRETNSGEGVKNVMVGKGE